MLSLLTPLRQRESCSQKEDTCVNGHHNLLFQNLLPNCKVLNINTPRNQKQPKETNWKQKFQKPKNENICLTYLNTENKRNSHFLSFCCALQMVQNLQRWTSLSFQQSGWNNYVIALFIGQNVFEKWHFTVISLEIPQ